ncbi:DNA processing/uptake protein [Mycoplasma yeatsii 13926]|uniref:DNA processing/uptake protein n=1 Tax=Mycoplasma yeatsii 13926 TaxID=1188240 RepID=S6G913_9MOLU|nr:DNA-processing protein DprA [Mycoplasma yeatsii]EOA07460.1 DNA processing/uptake protein [Mycoplasma yeatsii 13926]
MRNILLFFTLKYQYNWEKVFNALKNKEKISPETLENISNKSETNFISLVDHNYPKHLKDIIRPPFVLFYKGNINLTKSKSKIFSLVLDSTVDAYGKKNVFKLIDDLISNNKIISFKYNNDFSIEVIKYIINKKGSFIFLTDLSIKNLKTLNNEMFELIDNYDNSVIISDNQINDKISDIYKKDDSISRTLVGLANAVVICQNKEIISIQSVLDLCLEDDNKFYVFPEKVNSKFKANNLAIKQNGILVENLDDILNEL